MVIIATDAACTYKSFRNCVIETTSMLINSATITPLENLSITVWKAPPRQ